jgi:uncharacterized protein YbjT (DUF2867 family)
VVHLVGTPRPSPLKAAQFQAVDLASIRATVAAATRGSVRHLVYVSVAHPAPVMRAYIAVRQEGEALIRASGLPARLLRPWYVVGPGTGGRACCIRCTQWGSGCRRRELARGAWGW